MFEVFFLYLMGGSVSEFYGKWIFVKYEMSNYFLKVFYKILLGVGYLVKFCRKCIFYIYCSIVLLYCNWEVIIMSDECSCKCLCYYLRKKW